MISKVGKWKGEHNNVHIDNKTNYLVTAVLRESILGLYRQYVLWFTTCVLGKCKSS